ncbi:MAG: hypothetical protein B9S32_17090 [Verrucomicrobia bacterium Tous-C9LFEB]|nr:MAG: hypothetical protein B9S32_17090 [Verrucomicrobia bacterium Tous-C9LFEB]
MEEKKKSLMVLLVGSTLLATGCLLEHWIGTTFSSIFILAGVCGIWWSHRLLKQSSQPSEPISQKERVRHIGWVIFGGGMGSVIGFFMLLLQFPHFGVSACLLIAFLTFSLILAIVYWQRKRGKDRSPEE